MSATGLKAVSPAARHAWMVAFMILGSACASDGSRPGPEPLAADTQTAETEIPDLPEPPVEANFEPEDPLADVEEESLESAGFCSDDIYAKYLVAQYKATNPKPKAVQEQRRSRRSRFSARDQHEINALYWARSRFLGATSPYFGALPVVTNPRVEFWIQYFKTTGRSQFMKWLVRGESFKKMLHPVLKENGLPMEFFYLAMVESGFSNVAKSRARATGTWQFMQGTAKIYGLKINHWVDERRDPVKSTVAAGNYLRDLYGELGDWYLAMAAYNAGPGKIRKAMRLTGSRDFWTIAETSHIAKETRQYVPKVLAAVLLASDPKAHGFDFSASPNDYMPATEIIVRRPVRLADLAGKLGVTEQTLESWNPELIRNVVPPSRDGYRLKLPEQYASRYAQIEPSLPYIEITDVQMHVVRKGETLSRIARQYRVGLRQILAMNPRLDARRLRPGNSIAIPIPGVVHSSQRSNTEQVF